MSFTEKDTFKLQITLDRHNARQNLKYCALPHPPHFSLPSTFEPLIWDPEKTYSGSHISDPGLKRHRIPDPVRNTVIALKKVLKLAYIPYILACHL
jgi:hypothetical protein